MAWRTILPTPRPARTVMISAAHHSRRPVTPAGPIWPNIRPASPAPAWTDTMPEKTRTGARRAAQQGAAREHDRRLAKLYGQARHGLGCDQPRARQRRCPEPLKHAVTALEARGDGLAREGGGHDGQRKYARRDEIDPAAAADADQGLVPERD